MSRRSVIALALAIGLVSAACAAETGAESQSRTDPADETRGTEADDPTAAAGSESGRQGENVVQIGQLEPLTGGANVYGIPNRAAVEMAVEEVNGNGGLTIDGEKYEVELTVYDTECDPQSGVGAFERLVTRDEIKLILGTTCSSVGLAYQPLLAQHGALSLVTGASAPELADDPNMFHARATTRHYAAGYLRALEEDLDDVETVGILLDQTHPGWVGMKPTVVDQLTDMDIEVVAEEHYESDATDFYGQLTSLRSAAPDLIMMMGGFAHDDTKIWSQARELGLDAEMITHLAGTTDDYLAQVTTEVVEGFKGVSTPTMADFHEMEYEPAIEFEERFQEATGEEVGFTTLSSYSGAYLLFHALERAGTTTDIDAIKEALMELTVSDVPQLIEPIVSAEGDRIFQEPNGEVQFAVMLKEWRDGELRMISLYE